MKKLSLLLGSMLLGLSFNAFAQPPNDNFENAAVVNGNPVLGSNVDATAESGEPTNVERPGFPRSLLGGKSVWWKWTAPAAGSYSIKTGDRSGSQPSSNFDTQIGVYTGTALTNLVEVASNEDHINFQNGLSSVTINAVSNQTYYILVDGYQGATGTYALYVSQTRYTLSVSSTPGGHGTVVLDPPFQAQGYVAGSVVTLQAAPAEGKTFYAWTGSTNSTNATLILVMNEDKTIVANYAYDTQLVWQHLRGQLLSWKLLNTNFVGSESLGSVAPAWRLIGLADLDSNGTADFLWQRKNRQVEAQLMNGSTNIGSVSLGKSKPFFNLVGAGDFNGDNQPDLLYQRPNGPLIIQVVTNVTATTNYIVLPKPAAGWRAAVVTDFDKDGDSDILFQNRDGRVALWSMNDSTRESVLLLGKSGWKLIAATDLNDDSSLDLVFNTPGRPGAWLMNGTDRTSSIVLGNGTRLASAWRLAGASK